ncbi:MAG: hypothetical protein WB586_11040, partial [Chthoniobacterales bacterium]
SRNCSANLTAEARRVKNVGMPSSIFVYFLVFPETGARPPGLAWPRAGSQISYFVYYLYLRILYWLDKFGICIP